MKTLVIINPTAGQGKPRSGLDAVCEIFPNAECRETTARGDAERFAREAVVQNIARVLVMGGDGTVNEVINGIAGSSVQLGLLPLGTGNVLAREFGLPLNDVSAAAQIINEGNVIRIDLGKANGRYFVLMVGVGFDAEVVRKVAPQIKNIIGASAYVLTGLSTLARYRPVRTLLEIDDQKITTCAYLTIVSNATSYAYQIKVTPQASMQDGLLDICIFRERFTMGFLRMVMRVLSGRHLEHPHIHYLNGRSIHMETYPPAAVQLDGDYYGETPVDISIIPMALSIIVPKDYQ